MTLALTAAALGLAAPALAATTRNTPADCPAAELRGDAVFFVEPPDRELPEVLRSLDYDCAFDVDGSPDTAETVARTRVLVIQEPTLDEVLRTIRAIAGSPSWVLERTTAMPADDAVADLEAILERRELTEDVVAIFDRTVAEGRSSQRIDVRYVDSSSTTLGSASFTVDGSDEGLTLDADRGSYLSVSFGAVGDVSPASFDPEQSLLPWTVAFALSLAVAVGGGIVARRSGEG